MVAQLVEWHFGFTPQRDLVTCELDVNPSCSTVNMDISILMQYN